MFYRSFGGGMQEMQVVGWWVVLQPGVNLLY